MVVINSKQFNITNRSAEEAFMIPAGISLFFVLGFKLSMFLSMYRLNAIAALLAKIIHNNTNPNKSKSKELLFKVTASKKPIIAKGIANTV